MLFGGWDVIARTVVVGVLAYFALIMLLRVSGKRTLSKMNAFDFVVTVALGSTLATILLSRDVALAEGVTALALLIALQGVVAWLSVRFPVVERAVKSEPRLLAYRGRLLDEAMRRERVLDVEILQALRNQGVPSVDEAHAVVLETDGTLSVVKVDPGSARSSLRNVVGL
jgi:uncharacterized membrane protein YcaP (DUF421 family)